jgi:DNA-binding transcriptional MerR regulator
MTGQRQQTFTLAEIARRLEVPQHRLIHLCEKQVVVPDVQDADGRGSSRVFSSGNFLELAVAVRLRDMMLPVAATGAIIHVMRRLEARLSDELQGFSLVTSLTSAAAPDLRVIISDGRRIFFSLGQGATAPKLFGGVTIDELSSGGDEPPIAVVDGQTARRGFGGPEGSSFARSEISLTAIARSLPLA